MPKLLLAVLSAVILSSCATTGLGRLSLPFLNTYAAAKKDFDHGRIMEARARILAMDKNDKDYAKAKALLEGKIEPARKRLLKHYAGLAERHERAGEWYQAMQAYAQAATFSLHPQRWEEKRRAMEMKFRQARMNALLQLRRKMDAQWLAHQNDFRPPKGVPDDDEVFIRKKKQFQEELEERAERAYREAKWFLREGYPEIAYVEIESYLRFDPESEDGKKLMAEIKQALPKRINIPAYEKGKKKRRVVRNRHAEPKRVTVSMINALIKKGEWLKAKRYAQAYRRTGGKGAEELLKQIQAAIARQAEAMFDRGTYFYRKEQLDRAIEYWSKAVELAPENTEYAEALRRAKLLRERLELLRQSNPRGSDAQAPAMPAAGQ